VLELELLEEDELDEEDDDELELLLEELEDELEELELPESLTTASWLVTEPAELETTTV